MNRFERLICSNHPDPNFCLRILRFVRRLSLDPRRCRDFVEWMECLPKCEAGEDCFELPDGEKMCEAVYDDVCLKVCTEKWFETTCLGIVPWYLFLDSLPSERLLLGIGSHDT